MRGQGGRWAGKEIKDYLLKEDDEMYNVHFQINGVWCGNLAIGTEEQVRARYEKYGNLILSPASEWELRAARERGKPIVDCRR